MARFQDPIPGDQKLSQIIIRKTWGEAHVLQTPAMYLDWFDWIDVIVPLHDDNTEEEDDDGGGGDVDDDDDDDDGDGDGDGDGDDDDDDDDDGF